MAPGPKPADYYAGCNPALLRAVPESARLVLDVGCGEGRLGAALKRLRPDRVVYGVEREPAAAARAAAVLDRVFARDVTADPPPLEALDCLIFGDILEHLADPEAALRRYRDLLTPDGQVLCSIPNLQHHSLLAALLTGDFQYAPAGLLDATHLRFFTASTMLKLLLDAGLVPEVVEAIATGCIAIGVGIGVHRLRRRRSGRRRRARERLIDASIEQDYGPSPGPASESEDEP